MDLPDLNQMHQEWVAWRQLCQELEALGIQINDQDGLHARIITWGEELVALRIGLYAAETGT